jgi:hypothetical protein
MQRIRPASIVPQTFWRGQFTEAMASTAIGWVKRSEVLTGLIPSRVGRMNGPASEAAFSHL